MDKIFSIIALSCTLSIIYQTKILPYNGSFLGFVVSAVVGFFALVIGYKALKAIAILIGKLRTQTKSFMKTIPTRLGARRTALSFLLQKNTRLQLEIESLKADLSESSNELKSLVNNWSPNIGKPTQSRTNTLSIKPASQDMHEYEFIENAVKKTNTETANQEEAEQTT